METSLVDAMKLLAAAILVGGAAIGSATGVGGVGASLIESSARQPAEADRLQSKAFLMAGMLDAVPIMAVALALLILFGDPLG